MAGLPIAVGICSFGMSGKIFHAPFIDVHPGFRLHACWERSKKQVNDYYPGVISYNTYEEMLADKAIDLIIVNTPNYTHFEYAKLALEAGKHVVVEKPFTVLPEEGEALVVIAENVGKQVIVYHNRRNDSDFKTVQKILKEDLLGRIVEAEIHFDRYSLEQSAKKHKESDLPGTGVMYDLGIHLIDEAVELFGMPDAVFADVRTVRPVSIIDDYFELLMYYPDKRVRLHSTYIAREPSIGYVIHGERGSFIKPKTNGQEIALQAGAKPGSDGWGKEDPSEYGLLHTEINGTVVREKVESETGNYMDFFEGVYQAIANGKPVPVTAQDGIRNVRIALAAFESSSKQKVIKL